MKINDYFSIVNDNNPPGSHPVFITRMKFGSQWLTLNRSETALLYRAVVSIIEQNKMHEAVGYRYFQRGRHEKPWRYRGTHAR